jgi:6-phosphofructo-2-kinase/fructose-2,6-biphosphatase 2
MQIVVYTSGQPRAVATAREIPTNIIIHPALNSLNTGACTGMTFDDMEKTMPEELAQWKENPFTYRFPAGESQQDLVQKLQSLVMEFEGHVRPVAVISHISTLQVLYSYFLGYKFRPEKYHTLRFPKNTVIEMIPSHYGWQEVRYDLSGLESDAECFPGKVYNHNTNFYKAASARQEATEDD